MIIFFILITYLLDIVWKLWGEILSWSLRGHESFSSMDNVSLFVHTEYWYLPYPSIWQRSELFSFGRGVIRDFRRRWPHYLSDFKDGKLRCMYQIHYHRNMEYFSQILPCIFSCELLLYPNFFLKYCNRY